MTPITPVLPAPARLAGDLDRAEGILARVRFAAAWYRPAVEAGSEAAA